MSNESCGHSGQSEVDINGGWECGECMYDALVKTQAELSASRKALESAVGEAEELRAALLKIARGCDRGWCSCACKVAEEALCACGREALKSHNDRQGDEQANGGLGKAGA